MKIPIYCHHDKLVNPDQIKPDPENPNRHTPEQIAIYCKVIKANGWRRSIVISERSGLVVKGHGARLAAIEMSLTKVPVEIQKYQNRIEEVRDMIADNELAALSLRDDDGIAGLLNLIGGDPGESGVGLDRYEELLNPDQDGKIREIKIQKPPAMAWVLIGLPTIRYSEIAERIESLATVQGIKLESTVNNG